MVPKAQSTAEVAVLLVVAETSLGLFLALGGETVEESGGKAMVPLVGV